jgi:hypothetical protein
LSIPVVTVATGQLHKLALNYPNVPVATGKLHKIYRKSLK